MVYVASLGGQGVFSQREEYALINLLSHALMEDRDELSDLILELSEWGGIIYLFIYLFIYFILFILFYLFFQTLPYFPFLLKLDTHTFFFFQRNSNLSLN